MMAPFLLPRNDPAGLHHSEPLVGTITSVTICLVSMSIVSGFFAQRCTAIRHWKRIPLVVWLVLMIYIDSYLFIFVTAILQFAVGIDSDVHVCEGAVLLCLVCYITTKMLIYLFLVEKAHIIRGTTKSRFKSKLYCFNSFGMLGVYGVIAILNFIFRITRIDDGQCYIGMEKVSLIPLIAFDALVNIYLTILFIIPLMSLYSFKNFSKTSANIRLRAIALRTFFGALCTLTSSVVNLTVLMVLDGEPGWVCLMCCNSDILFSAVVVQWVTSKDNAATHDLADGNLRTEPSPTADDIRLQEGQYSPHAASSQKQVMDDVDEVFLESAGHSQHGHSGKSSLDTDQMRNPRTNSLPSNGGGGVVVTTTVKCEARHAPVVRDMTNLGSRRMSTRGSRPVSGELGIDSYTMGHQTKIATGKRP